MISGAVIIGRPIGPEMTRPFTVNDFHSLQSYCNLALWAECPISVAYPETLSNPKLAYQEGVLVNICHGKDEQEFRTGIGERLVIAAKNAERIYSEYSRRGQDLPWKGQSDLDCQKVCWVGIKKGTTELVYRPYMEVIAVYDSEKKFVRYPTIVSRLSKKTMIARKKRSGKRELWVHNNNLGLVNNWIFRD